MATPNTQSDFFVIYILNSLALTHNNTTRTDYAAYNSRTQQIAYWEKHMLSRWNFPFSLKFTFNTDD